MYITDPLTEETKGIGDISNATIDGLGRLIIETDEDYVILIDSDKGEMKMLVRALSKMKGRMI